MEGKLYLCPTPIGNLEDITLRVIHTLEACQAIYCEDTRRTALLMQKLGIKKPLIACHAHNERQRAEEINQRALNLTKRGSSMADEIYSKVLSGLV